APIGAHDQARLVGEKLVFADEGRRAAILARPAGILDEAIARDEHRKLRFDHLHGLVGAVAAGIGDAVLAVTPAQRTASTRQRLPPRPRASVAVHRRALPVCRRGMTGKAPPPSPAAGAASGRILPSAPNSASSMRQPMRARAAHAAGGRGLTMQPSGATVLM